MPRGATLEAAPNGTLVTLLIAGKPSSTGSTFGNGLVEQQDLLLVGRLKNRCPPFKVSPCHRRGCPLARRIATFSSLDQLLQGRLEVMQFDSHPQSSRPESLLIPFNSRPVAPLQNHALAPGKEVLGKNPQLMFETHSELFIPQIGTQFSVGGQEELPSGGHRFRSVATTVRSRPGRSRPTITCRGTGILGSARGCDSPRRYRRW